MDGRQGSEVFAYVVLVCLSLISVLILFDLYRPAAADRSRTRFLRWASRFDFAPAELHGFSYWRLALVSFLGLFLQLLLIRWVSSEIRLFAYFKNFVLIASFLGFGLGCYLCRRKMSLLPALAPLGILIAIVELPWPPLRRLIEYLPIMMGSVSEVSVWGVPNLPLSWGILALLALGCIIVVPLFALISLVSLPIGQMVGWYLEEARNGIWGYSVNILGSLAGILTYTLLCYVYQPPAVWFLVAGVAATVLFWPSQKLRKALIVSFGVCSAALFVNSLSDQTTVMWSPYQKLIISPTRDGDEVVAYQLTTNGSWHQQVVDLSEDFVARHPGMLGEGPLQFNAYNLPYQFAAESPSVLVLGAGMGNDVAGALRNGAERVVAVEIDPLIIEQGRKLHFERPYDSERVEVVIDDARSYIQNSEDKFDAIVFALLDSHTTSSHYTNIRIDNYVYTEEAFRAAKNLLKPGGIFVVKFQVNTPWIAGRLHDLTAKVFEHEPLDFRAYSVFNEGVVGALSGRVGTIGARFFVTGSQQQIDRAMSEKPELAAFIGSLPSSPRANARLTSDDWPFFYQRAPGIPASILVISFILVFLSAFLIRRTGMGDRPVRWHFFFLGAAFLLLEAQLVGRLALLFGTTWLVNSIVIGAVLLLIVAANFLVEKYPRISTQGAYVGIAVSLLITYLVPLELFFSKSMWVRGLAATSLYCLPVFFASIVFVRSFASVGFSAEALGSNLFGALVGGLLESASLWIGIKALLLLVGLLYAASYLTMRRSSAPSPSLEFAPSNPNP